MASRTKHFALFGHPVAHSLSAVMYNAAFRHLGLDWHYEAQDVAPADLKAAFARFRSEGFIGGNVTVPYKMAMMELMDEVDASAKLFGAVNTIVNIGASAEPRFLGYNTDGYGLVQALREEFQLELRGKSVVILGAGGAGRAAAVQCAMEKVATVFLVNRTREKADELAADIRARFPSVTVQVSLPPNWRADLMINATSLGLHPHDPKPIICGQIADVPFVFDMIYRPADTKFLSCARDGGARTANGFSMLLHQGVRALDLWLAAHVPEKGLRAPVEVMRAALKAAM